MPDDLVEQIAWVHEACEAMGVPIFTAEGFEADDVLGTLAGKAAAPGFEVAIVTGDKDFFQLVGDGIRVYNPRDEGAWFDAAGRARRNSASSPAQVVDVLALMGDTIDNVKGVPGIGEKGARDLIVTYGSLDAAAGARRRGAAEEYREGLKTHADQARQSRELVEDSHRRRRRLRRRAVPLPRAFARALLRAVLAAGVPHAGAEFAPTADSVAEGLRGRGLSTSSRRWSRTSDARPRLALAVISDGTAPVRAIARRHRALDRAAPGALRAARARGFTARQPRWIAVQRSPCLRPSARDAAVQKVGARFQGRRSSCSAATAWRSTGSR